MAKYASESWSNSKAQTWEGIEGYVPEWIKKDQLNTKQQALRDKQTPDMMSKEDFAKMYGFVYGDDIDKAYDQAVKAKYDEMDAYSRMARDSSLQDMTASHDQYLQTLREQRARAPQTGIMKGASMAAELQGMFGSQNNMVESQQAYQDQMAKLMYERGTATEQARINALQDKNKVAAQMGQLGTEKYGMDVQNEASYLSYLAQYDQNTAAMLQAAGVWNQAEGQNTRRKTSESTSSSYSYDDSANIAAAAQRYAADQSAAAQRDAANAAASAQRYAAQQAAASRPSGGGGSSPDKSAYNTLYNAYKDQGLSHDNAVLAAMGRQPNMDIPEGRKIDLPSQNKKTPVARHTGTFGRVFGKKY